MAFLHILGSTICSSWHSQASQTSLGTFCLQSFQALSLHSSNSTRWTRVQWLHNERGTVWATGGCSSRLHSENHHNLTTARPICGSAIGLCPSNKRIQCSAAERTGVRHSQMAVLLVIWWQTYTARARPLLMLLLDGGSLKTIPTITSILQSVKNSLYWAPSPHRCPANTIGFTNKKDMEPFPRVHHHKQMSSNSSKEWKPIL